MSRHVTSPRTIQNQDSEEQILKRRVSGGANLILLHWTREGRVLLHKMAAEEREAQFCVCAAAAPLYCPA